MRKFLSVALLGLVGACQPGPASLSEADVAAIRALGDVYAQAVIAADADAVAESYAVDATEMPPNEPSVSGREAIREKYVAGFSYGISSVEFTMTSQEIYGTGDLAYDRGTWTWSGVLPGMAEPVADTGKYLSIARRQGDGAWLYTDVIWNSDTPLPEAEPAADEPLME
ncbi:MAG: SgcJ/EcaC family oxidoreductase [Gemmatimonadetes bacterium]|nr:SgcJ/EcaC family oxidoreductase [Gemmatimonadota bacterium]